MTGFLLKATPDTTGLTISWTITAILAPFLLAAMALAGCAGLPENFAREESPKLDTSDTRLARAFDAIAAAHPGQSGAYPLGHGIEALAARVNLARLAEKSLDVQYYIWHGDESGRLLLKELLDAADRGVRVRLLLDDLGVGAANDDVFVLLDAHPNFSVSLFNPIASRDSRTMGLVADAKRLNRRMHNKSMTADNTLTVVGGRNITKFPPTPVDVKFNLPEEILRIVKKDIICLHTPGHTPGSICIYLDHNGKRVLFAQDLHGPLLEEFGSNIEDWDRSTQKLLDLDADFLCEGHFGIFKTKKDVKSYILSYRRQYGVE